MKLKRIFLSMLALVAYTAMAQMQMPTIPTDEAVRMGKLDNGLTYYIRYNNWPEHRANFYIAQKVGSLQEEESQRGLAHFLEHMCFNGTKHFKGNELIKYCESIGVKFGEDLNAYTSIDQTVYNIDNVPTDRQSALDSCLLILYDWADGLALEDEEIDKERGVIHEEYRLRMSAQQRMLERALPTLYPNSKYGQRMPIGLMSVVDNFKPKELKDYYEKWYRPDNQGIIVVGDVDVDHIEAKIKELFGGIKLPENPAPVEEVAVPDNNDAIVIVEKDKEQRMNMVQLMFKHDVFPKDQKNTILYYVNDYLTSAVVSMLNARFQEEGLKPECPYVAAQADDGEYLLSKTKDAFTIFGVPKDGQMDATLTALVVEARRAAEYGFTATEYQRFQADMLSGLDKMYSNKDKRYSSQFYQEILANFLEGDPIASIDFYYNTMKALVPQIPVDAVNMAIKELVLPSDTNMVILNMNNEKEGAVYPTVEGLKAAVAAGRAAEVTAYVDNVKNEPIMSEMPKAGTIKKEEKSDKFDYKTLTLSNGAKVILKKTDYKKDEVVLQGEGEGGSSLYGIEDFANLQAFDDVIAASGLGKFTDTELQKALAGKNASCGLSLSLGHEYLSARSTPKDLETMFQLVYLMMTDICKDQKAFDNLKNQYEIMLKNRGLTPEAAFADSVKATVYKHNPRFRPMELSDVKDINYDRVLQIAKELTSNAAAYTFTIVGNFEEDSIRPLICQYIASLPANKKIVKGKKLNEMAKGVVINNFKRKMETPKANSVMLWTSDKMKYNLENDIRADIAGQVLTQLYLKKIREEGSMAYSVGASASISKDDFGEVEAAIQTYCPMKYEKADSALMLLRDEVPALAENCDAELLKKAQEYMIKNIDDASKTNAYWMSVISAYRKHGIDFYTDYKNVVNAQTPDTISAFVKELLKAGNRIEVVMLPEE